MTLCAARKRGSSPKIPHGSTLLFPSLLCQQTRSRRCCRTKTEFSRVSPRSTSTEVLSRTGAAVGTLAARQFDPRPIWATTEQSQYWDIRKFHEGVMIHEWSSCPSMHCKEPMTRDWYSCKLCFSFDDLYDGRWLYCEIKKVFKSVFTGCNFGKGG